MTEAIICPDCGGVVGGDPASGVQVCKCFQSVPAVYNPNPDPAIEAARISAAKVEKICRACGKNLSGHRRVRDSSGYLCIACMKAEEEAKVDGMVKCPECGRYLKPAGLVNYHNTMICKKCYADHQELSKYKAPPPDMTALKIEEKQSLKKLLIIAGVLLALFLLAYFGILGSSR